MTTRAFSIRVILGCAVLLSDSGSTASTTELAPQVAAQVAAQVALIKHPLNLKQAIDYALEHSPTLNSSVREKSIREMEKENSIASFLPSLDLSATHGFRKTTPISGSMPSHLWGGEATVSLTETLYDNGSSLTKFRISKLNSERAEIFFRRERDLLCKEVGLEFLQFSLASKLLGIQQEQHQLLKKQYESVAGRYHQGLTVRKDFLRFKTQLSRSNIDLVNSENSVEKSTRELNRLLAVPLDLQTNIEFILDEQKIQWGQLSKISVQFEKHYDFQVAMIQKKIDDLEFNLIDRKYWPEIFLDSAVTYHAFSPTGSPTTSANKDQLEWSAMLTLKYNIWDWGIRRKNAEVAQQRKSIQSNEIDAKLFVVRSEIERLLLDLKQLTDRFKLSEELLALEKTNLSLLNKEYQNGRTQFLDLITGLKDLADAKVKYFTAFYELKRGILSLQYHQGTLYESITKK